MKTYSQDKYSGFIIAIIITFLFFFFINFNLIFAQNLYENGRSGSFIASTNSLPSGNIPGEFKLYQNYKNAETIRFDVPEISHVKITVFNIRGAIMKAYLYDNIQPGTHQIDINDLENGNYTYSMAAEGYSQTYNMTIYR